ncbi:MAG: TetR/AcrR family transcriptional regulator [Bdellovibrionales bacterium]
MAKTTQVKILENAQDLFWSKGHKATSLDQIAQKTGQSKGAIFHYFRNKDDITKLVLEHYAQRELYTPLERGFDGQNNVKNGLLCWVEGIYAGFSKRNYHSGCLLGNMALELADQDEEIRQDIAKIFLDWENQLVGLLKSHAKDGQLLMEPRQLARLIIAGLQGITMTIKVHKDKNRAAREFQALGELIERLIKD